MRSVPSAPLTFALMRLLCFDASISHTSVAAIPFCRASRRIGSTTRASASFFGELKIGVSTTGAITLPKNTNAIPAIAPHTHHVRGSLRTIAYSAAIISAPNTSAMPKPFACSPSHAPNVRFESPYECSRTYPS